MIIFGAYEYIKDFFLLYWNGYRIVRKEELAKQPENEVKGQEPPTTQEKITSEEKA